MTWLIRYLLSLPARPSDINEIRQNFPELLSPRGASDLINTKRLYRLLLPFEIELTGVKEWAKDTGNNLENPTGQAKDCTKIDCPIRLNGDQYRPFLEGSSDEPIIFQLMYAAGGPRKEPLKAFLNLVKQVHAGAKAPDKIFLTDPYLLSSSSENGKSGGYQNLIEYLKALGLEKSSVFKIMRSSSGKKSDIKSTWEEVIRVKFPNCSFGFFSNRYSYHDRFYIVDHGKGDIRGIFGPSLNGLTSNSIVLMGEIERGSNGLSQLLKMLN